jgi:hypothetical protein
MNIEPYLAGHAFMQVERPPLLWEVEAEEEPFVRLLGEMIAVGLGRGNELAELVLSAANVTVPPEAAGDRLPAGDYVAISVRGEGDWGPDESWYAGEPRPKGWIRCMDSAARGAGITFAYLRTVGNEGSVTVYYRRLLP